MATDDLTAFTPARIPPAPEFVEEYHAVAGCRVGRRADGVLLFVFGDFQPDTIRAVVAWDMSYLDGLQAPERHLLDLRPAPPDFPVHAFQGAMKVMNHPAAQRVRLAILVRHSAVARLVETVARITAGAQAQLFTDEAAANTWLGLPPAPGGERT